MYLATQRLRTLVAACPNDVEIHRRLADVYRRAGNAVEAGRWGFVTAEVSAAELAAFERAHPSAWLRLRLLGWTAGPDGIPDPAAGQRLRDLLDRAVREGPPARYGGPLYQGHAPSERFPCLFIAGVVLVVAVLAAVGFYRIVRFVLF
jgi:uncharacterized protein DUF6584